MTCTIDSTSNATLIAYTTIRNGGDMLAMENNDFDIIDETFWTEGKEN